jgi:putative phage-type endonuclease
MTPTERADWLKKRMLCVTGTDIAGILGISPWTTPFQVWQSKVDPQDLPDQANEAMRWGTRLEPAIADAYMQECGAKSLVKGEFTTRDFDGLPAGGTPDYLRPEEQIVLEIKTARGAHGWGDQGTDDIPMYYLTQVMWYMGLIGWNMAHVTVLIGGSDMRTYNVPMDRELFGEFVSRAREFWALVTAKTPPPIDGSESCRYWITRQYVGKKGILAAPPAPLIDDVAALRDIHHQKNELEELEATLKNRILAGMGEFDRTAIAGVGRITVVRGSETTKTDWKAVSEASGASQELIMRHTTKSQRASYLKPTWDKE